jgi:hypothetical protein
MDSRPGCLGGLLRLFLLDKLFDWLQGRVGFGRGGCGGCGCGVILVIIFLILFISIIFGTDWLRLISAYYVV